MPTGKVKWFDAEKGFGFLSQEDGADVYVRSDALPEGTTTLKPGTRVEFGIAQGRRGDQALQVRILDAPGRRCRATSGRRSARSPRRWSPIVEDLIRLLDGVGEAYRHGRHPDRTTAGPVGQAAARAGRRARGLGLDAAGRHGRARGRSGRRARRSPYPATGTRRRASWPAPGPPSATSARHREPEPGVQRQRDADEATEHPGQLAASCRCGRRRWSAPARGRRAGSWSRATAWRATATRPAIRPSRASVEHAVEERGDQHDQPRRRPGPATTVDGRVDLLEHRRRARCRGRCPRPAAPMTMPSSSLGCSSRRSGSRAAGTP